MNVRKSITSKKQLKIPLENASSSKEWTCKECTFSNDPFKMLCDVCRAKKPETPGHSVNKWVCKGCTWINAQKFIRCEMCEAKRPILQKGPAREAKRPILQKRPSTELPKRKLPIEQHQTQSKLTPKDDSFALQLKIDKLERKLANKDRLIANLKKSLIKLRASQVTKPSSSDGIFGISPKTSQSKCFFSSLLELLTPLSRRDLSLQIRSIRKNAEFKKVYLLIQEEV